MAHHYWQNAPRGCRLSPFRQMSQTGEFSRKLRNVTTRIDTVLFLFFINCYLVNMYAAIVQSPCSLLEYPSCSAVCVTIAQRPCLHYIHSTEQYITIRHPVAMLTTTRCLSPRQSAHLQQMGGGGFHRNSYILTFTHLKVNETGIY